MSYRLHDADTQAAYHSFCRQLENVTRDRDTKPYNSDAWHIANGEVEVWQNVMNLMQRALEVVEQRWSQRPEEGEDDEEEDDEEEELVDLTTLCE